MVKTNIESRKNLSCNNKPIKMDAIENESKLTQNEEEVKKEPEQPQKIILDCNGNPFTNLNFILSNYNWNNKDH